MKKETQGKKMKSISKLRIGIVVLVIALLVSIPFVGTLNSTPLTLFGVSITPQQEYRIQFDLPHIKPITPAVRRKAEAHLSEVFGIAQPTFKSKNLLSKPLVVLKRSFVTSAYTGYIKIGNVTIPFSKVKEQFSNKENDKKNEPPPKLLLTAYFTANTTPFRANIFIINSGSVLQYASTTIQDEEDNVLAMFTHGRADFSPSEACPGKVANTSSPGVAYNSSGQKNGVPSDSSEAGSSSWATEKVLKQGVKYIAISDPACNLPPQKVPVIRLNAMSNYPFNNYRGAANTLSLRAWAFNKQIESAYKDFYRPAGWGSVSAHACINGIEGTIETKFPSEINESSLYPKESRGHFTHAEVSFNLFGAESVSYPITSGSRVRTVWTLKNTQSGECEDAEPFNYGKLTAVPFNAFSLCSPNLFWRFSLNDAPNDNSHNDYGGFYGRYQTVLYKSGKRLYALYSSKVYYGIKVVSTAHKRVDYYCFSVSESFPEVDLAGQ